MVSGNPLDDFKDAYKFSFQFELDNRLILNWYPERIMALNSGSSVLELGVGHGYSTVRFADKYPKLTVIEGSTAVISQFREKFPECSACIKEGYFETFQTEERFDCIIMGFILEHVDNPAEILHHYKKFLNPGGSVFITVPNAEALNKRIGYEAGLINDMAALSAADLALGHQRLFTLKSLHNLVASQGYHVEAVEGVFLKPITTQQICELHLSESVLEGMMKVGVDFPELCVGLLMQIRLAP